MRVISSGNRICCNTNLVKASKWFFYNEVAYEYAEQDNYWYAKELLMTDLIKAHSTKIIMEEIKFDQGLSDDIFTVDKLKQD